MRLHGRAPALAVLAAVLLAPAKSTAHQQSLSYGEVTVHGAAVQARLRFAAADLAPLLQLDQDADGKLTQHDLDLLGPALPKATIGEMHVRSDGVDCTASPGTARLEPPDGIVVSGSWICPAPVATLVVRTGFVELLAAGHTHLARISFAGRSAVAQRIAQVGQETYVVDRPRGPGALLRLFLRGIRDTFSLEHAAFLLGLLLLGWSSRTLARMVLGFAVASSITLALATLDLLVPPPRLIGPLVAASLLYVAAENLWASRAHGRRWVIAVVFGLPHGFALAASLRELSLPDASLFKRLVGFNLGVAAGLCASVAVLVPLLVLLRRRRWFLNQGVRTFSAAIGVAGVVLLVHRLVIGH